MIKTVVYRTPQTTTQHRRYGKISCNLLNVAIPLDKIETGDGGFVIIPGSHKANFPLPPEIAECDKLEENKYLINPALDPGELTPYSNYSAWASRQQYILAPQDAMYLIQSLPFLSCSKHFVCALNTV